MLQHRYCRLRTGMESTVSMVTGAYVIIMLVNNTLTWQSSCVIANNALKTAMISVHEV